MINRRSFLRSILPVVAGVIVAPTLAETLLVSAKKYFFLSAPKKYFFLLTNPPEIEVINSEWLAKDISSTFGIPYYSIVPNTFPWGGLSRSDLSINQHAGEGSFFDPLQRSN